MSDVSTAVELGEAMSMVGDDAPQDQPHQEAEAEAEIGECAPAVAGKRAAKSGEEKLAKRPRWGDKAFDDITIGDVETLVRKCALLEKKVEANAEAALQLKELQSQKKALEKEMTDVGSDEVAKVKSAIAKQLYAQMMWVFAWNAELKEGRSISAFVPNVSPELLKALGGSTGASQQKRCIWYFEKAPVKSVSSTRKNEQPLQSGLVLGANLTLKYIKTTSELQVETTYKFGDPEAKKAKKEGKKAGRPAKKGAAVDDAPEEMDAEDAEDGDEEEAAADDKPVANDSEADAIAVGGQ